MGVKLTGWRHVPEHIGVVLLGEGTRVENDAKDIVVRLGGRDQVPEPLGGEEVPLEQQVASCKLVTRGQVV